LSIKTKQTKKMALFENKTGYLIDPVFSLTREREGQAPVAHACNPSYSGGRDQED
jgi:hypothetical protein